MKEYIEAMRKIQQGELYFKLVLGLVALVDGTAEDSGLDAHNRQEVFGEIENAIDLIRRATGEI